MVRQPYIVRYYTEYILVPEHDPLITVVFLAEWQNF